MAQFFSPWRQLCLKWHNHLVLFAYLLLSIFPVHIVFLLMALNWLCGHIGFGVEWIECGATGGGKVDGGDLQRVDKAGSEWKAGSGFGCNQAGCFLFYIFGCSSTALSVCPLSSAILSGTGQLWNSWPDRGSEISSDPTWFWYPRRNNWYFLSMWNLSEAIPEIEGGSCGLAKAVYSFLVLSSLIWVTQA